MLRCSLRSALAGSVLAVTSLFWLPLPPASAAEAQVQLRCDGALIDARGVAQLKRTTSRLAFSLGLEAEAPDADAALGVLQQRLVVVRQALKRLEVNDLRVGSPSSWSRAAEPGRPPVAQVSLQVRGELAPQRLQALVREVGRLPGVQLSPVTTQADPRGDAAARRSLLRDAFADARRQAEELAAVAGFSRVTPLELRLDGMEQPMPWRAMADASPQGFNPDELPLPINRVGMGVSFCAT
jgi:uncharacterized protein YggE